MPNLAEVSQTQTYVPPNYGVYSGKGFLGTSSEQSFLSSSASMAPCSEVGQRLYSWGNIGTPNNDGSSWRRDAGSNCEINRGLSRRNYLKGWRTNGVPSRIRSFQAHLRNRIREGNQYEIKSVDLNQIYNPIIYDSQSFKNKGQPEPAEVSEIRVEGELEGKNSDSDPDRFSFHGSLNTRFSFHGHQDAEKFNKEANITVAFIDDEDISCASGGQSAENLEDGDNLVDGTGDGNSFSFYNDRNKSFSFHSQHLGGEGENDKYTSCTSGCQSAENIEVGDNLDGAGDGKSFSFYDDQNQSFSFHGQNFGNEDENIDIFEEDEEIVELKGVNKDERVSFHTAASPELICLSDSDEEDLEHSATRVDRLNDAGKAKTNEEAKDKAKKNEQDQTNELAEKKAKLKAIKLLLNYVKKAVEAFNEQDYPKALSFYG